MARRSTSSLALVLATSVGAVALSTTLVLAIVRPDGAPSSPGVVRTAAAATAESSSPRAPAEPALADAEPASPPEQTPPPAPEPPPLPWPDLRLDQVPPLDDAPEPLGQSLGSPRDGALLHPTRLPSHRHYRIRNPQTAWGTSNTIEHLRAAIGKVRRRHPRTHRPLIGDLSTRRGGPLDGHTSHQSGRDADVGLLHRQAEDPTEFIEATRGNLDLRATFDLLVALAATRDEPTGVELIVLDYHLQRMLRRDAEARGVPKAQLDALFQFPRGPQSRHGLVRHKPAHRDHLHVRFRCPEGDDYCRSPLIGFAGIEAAKPRPADPEN